MNTGGSHVWVSSQLPTFTTYVLRLILYSEVMVNMDIIWKPVVGYEGWYEVSSKGDVRSVDHVVRYIKHYRNMDVEATHHFKSKLLTQSLKGTGYRSVILSKNGVTATKLVHRLVAEAFIPNPDNKSQVNHIDGIRFHNDVDNLEWVTGSENQRKSIESGTHTSCRGVDTRVPVRCITTGVIFKSMSAAELFYNLPSGKISECIHSNTRTRGLEFEIVDAGCIPNHS